MASIRRTVGAGRAICALSGGVDSSVAATLVHRAIGEHLTLVFVNNGVLRKNEFEKVQQNLRDKLGLNLLAVDATDRFSRARHDRPSAAPSSATNTVPSSTRRAASRSCRATSIRWSRARSILT